MSNQKTLDARIQAALQEDTVFADLSGPEEMSLFSQALQIFRGRNRWINAIMVVYSLVCLGFSTYAAYRFFMAVEVKELIAWSVTFSVGILTISITKIWAWLEMQRYNTVREIKRLELQVAMLRDQLSKSEPLSH